jgi:hypothetical protein
MIIELEIGGGHLIVRGENLSISVTEAKEAEAVAQNGWGHSPSLKACLSKLA